MRLLLATLGSRGDVEPFIALALALQQAGHEPVLCASRRYGNWIGSWGIDFQPLDDGFVTLLESLEGRAALERAGSVLGMARSVWRLLPQIKPLQLRMQRDLWAAAQAVRPQGLVFHVKLAGAPDVADALGIPAALLLLAPMLAATSAHPCAALPPWMAALGHRNGFRLVRGLSRLSAGAAKDWRRETGRGPRPAGLDLLGDANGRPWPLLHAHSPALLPSPADWPENAAATGFLRLGVPSAWQPDPALEAFLAAGPAPVYVGFGSMAGRSPQERAREVLQALQHTGLRGVIGRGWGGLQPGDLPQSVFAVSDVPHAWLFPRMAAVVHHGGAGTTAAGLAAGRPTLICPFFGDQPFWGNLVHTRGLGPAPLAQRRLNAASLSAALRALTDDAALQQRCQALGERLQAEDGGLQAVRWLERVLR